MELGHEGTGVSCLFERRDRRDFSHFCNGKKRLFGDSGEANRHGLGESMEFRTISVKWPKAVLGGFSSGRRPENVNSSLDFW